MNTSPSFPLNAWYAAAYDVEVKHALLARTVCNQKLALYRKSDGEVAALEDACWHRLMPLSMGRLEGDEVVCGYHGLVYNAQGRCTFMPSQETLNPSACVRSYPVVEKHRFVWVWPGDPAKADPALVPDMHWNDDPAWAGDGKMIRVACDYRLVVDNLMDLTHETFVHGSSIGSRAVGAAPFGAPHGARPATARWAPDDSDLPTRSAPRRKMIRRTNLGTPDPRCRTPRRRYAAGGRYRASRPARRCGWRRSTSRRSRGAGRAGCPSGGARCCRARRRAAR